MSHYRDDPPYPPYPPNAGEMSGGPSRSAGSEEIYNIIPVHDTLYEHSALRFPEVCRRAFVAFLQLKNGAKVGSRRFGVVLGILTCNSNFCELCAGSKRWNFEPVSSAVVVSRSEAHFRL